MTIDTHIDPVTQRALTPSEVVARVRVLVRRSLAGLVLEGEVSNRSTSGRGHLYFKVADADSAVACVAWKGMRGGLLVDPADGQRVRVSVREGAYYGEKLLLVASQVEPIGEGVLLERARKLLAQLAAEGLGEAARKQPLPRFPRAVGLIAGSDARAVADVVEAIHERFPARVVLCRSAVQGVSAPSALIEALARLQAERDVDVIVVARGGGSVEDRDAFNHEGLCRAIAASRTPVVTAIGHSEDSHVADAVADLSCPVPRAVGRYVVPSLEDVLGEIELGGEALAAVASDVEARGREISNLKRFLRAEAVLEKHTGLLAARDSELRRLGERLVRGIEGELVQREREIARASAAIPRARAVDGLSQRLRDCGRVTARELASRRQRVVDHDATFGREARRSLERWARMLQERAALLAASDPAARGYAVIRLPSGALVTGASDLSVGERVSIELADGSAKAAITSITKGERA